MALPSSSLERLIEALRHLPGVGPKSAQRMAYFLLQKNHAGAQRLSQALTDVITNVRYCESCNNFSEASICNICSSADRDKSLIAVVEYPADLAVIEQTHSYQGLYFVLMGKLNPLEGIGPKDIYLDKLVERVTDGDIKEIIIATNFTVEGEATAHYISEILRGRELKLTRMARGLPVGGEIEYIDSGTIAQALVERRNVV